MDPYAQALGIKDRGAPKVPVVSDGTIAFQAKDPAALRAELAARADPSVVARFDEMVPGYAPKDPYADALGIGKAQPAQPAPAQAAQPQAPASRGEEKSPVFDFFANQVSGIGSTIAGGYRGLYTLATGGSMDDAANAVRETQQAGTFVPRTAEGQAAVDAFSSKYNPLNWPGVVGDYLGGKLADAGMPGAGAAVNAVTTVAPMALGIKSLREGVKSVPGRLADLRDPTPSAARVEPTLGLTDVPSAPIRQPVPQSQKVPALLRKPEPAAAPVAPAAPVAAPDLTQASPELKTAVQQAQATGKQVNPVVLQRHVEADTLPVPVKLTEGQATLDPMKISEEMNSRGKTGALVSPEFYKTQAVNLAKNIDALKEKTAPDVIQSDPTSLGQSLVDAYKRKDAPIVADIDAKYQALRDAAGGDFPVDARALSDNINAALKKELLTHDAPPSQMTELQQLAKEGNMTFEQFLSLRRNLGNIARTSTDGNMRTAASIMVQQLEDLPLKGGAADLKPLADAARSAARSRFQALEADPAYKAAVGDGIPEGQPSPLADRFATNQVVGGRYANVARMRENLAGDPEALQAMSAAVVEHLRKASKADPQVGAFSQNGYNGALRTLGPKLDVALGPEAAQIARQLGNTARLVQSQPRGSFVNNSNTLVGALSDSAAAGLRGALAVKTGGLSEAAIAGVKAMKRGKQAEQSVAPGAGITLGDLPGVKP